MRKMKVLLLANLLLLGINTVNSACNSSYSGCSGSAQCDVEFVEAAVYGCTGEWENQGVTHGSYLCADGYSICDSVSHAEALGLTYDLCMGVDVSIEKNYYYVTMIGYSDGDPFSCSTNGTNGLFGCAAQEYDVSWLKFLDSSDCGPFGAYTQPNITGTGNETGPGENNAPGWAFGWEVWDNSGSVQDLVNYVRHIEIQECCWTPVSSYIGGVMCCASNLSDTTTTEAGTTTHLPTTTEATTTNTRYTTTYGEGTTTNTRYTTTEHEYTTSEHEYNSTSDEYSTTDDDYSSTYYDSTYSSSYEYSSTEMEYTTTQEPDGCNWGLLNLFPVLSGECTTSTYPGFSSLIMSCQSNNYAIVKFYEDDECEGTLVNSTQLFIFECGNSGIGCEYVDYYQTSYMGTSDCDNDPTYELELLLAGFDDACLPFFNNTFYLSFTVNSNGLWYGVWDNDDCDQTNYFQYNITNGCFASGDNSTLIEFNAGTTEAPSSEESTSTPEGGNGTNPMTTDENTATEDDSANELFNVRVVIVTIFVTVLTPIFGSGFL